MIIGDRSLRTFDLVQNPKANVILRGVKDSDRRLSLLKSGRSLSRSIKMEASVKGSVGRIVGFSEKDSDSKSVFQNHGIEDAYREKSQQYIHALQSRLEDTKHLPLHNNLNQKPTNPSTRPKNLIREAKSFDSKLRTEREIMSEAINRFDHVKDLKMKALLIDSHATTLRLHYQETLQNRLDKVHAIKSQLFLTHYKSKPVVLNLHCERRPQSKSKLVMHWHSNLITSSVRDSNLLKNFVDRMGGQNLTQESGYGSKNFTKSSRNFHIPTLMNLPTAKDTFHDGDNPLLSNRRKKSRRPKRKQKVQGITPRTFSLNNLITPRTKIGDQYEKYAISKGGAGGKDYVIKNVEREEIKKAVKELVHSKKTDNERINKLLGS